MSCHHSKTISPSLLSDAYTEQHGTWQLLIYELLASVSTWYGILNPYSMGIREGLWYTCTYNCQTWPMIIVAGDKVWKCIYIKHTFMHVFIWHLYSDTWPVWWQHSISTPQCIPQCFSESKHIKNTCSPPFNCSLHCFNVLS